MSNTINRLARQIATKLDSSDKDGQNRKIDKDTWNPFVAGKGNSIKKYIGVDNASRSIAYYLNRESSKSGESRMDIAEKWLSAIDRESLMKEFTLDEIIVKSERQKNNPTNNTQPDENPLASTDTEPAPTQAPASAEATVSLPVQNPAAVTESLTPEPDIADVKQEVKEPANENNSSNVQAAGNVAAAQENPENNSASEEQLTDLDTNNNDYSCNFKNQVQIYTTLSPLLFKFHNIFGIKDIIGNISIELAYFDTNELTKASVIKTIKDRCLSDIRRAFNYNTAKSSRFIYSVATAITEAMADKNKAGTRDDIMETAQDYYDAGIKTQAEGNVYFSGNRRRAWCADTVSTILKEALGDQLPESFGSASVSNLRSWGYKHNCYTETSKMRASARKEFIANNVKVGDIMIEKRNNKSHTGIVIEVADDGSWFKTIEGNSSKSVAERTYSSNSATLSGFVSMEQFVLNTDDKEDCSAKSIPQAS